MRRAQPSALRGPVLRLYRHCLRSANRCPELRHRATMWQYVQMSFRDNAALDERNAMMKLSAGEQELADMNELHDLREARDAAPSDEPLAAGAAEEPMEPADHAGVEHSPPPPQHDGQWERSDRERATMAAPCASKPLPGIVAAALSVIGSTDFLERALRGEDVSLTITADEVRRRLVASQEDELARWRQQRRIPIK